MEAWWSALGLITKGFFVAALFFSVLFIWQLIMTFFGVMGDFGADADHAPGHDFGADTHDVSADAQDAGVDAHDHPGGDSADQHAASDHSFTLISFRSLIAFGTLFSWAGAMYLMSGVGLIAAVIYGFLWGLAAMLAVSYLVYWLLRLQDTGAASIWAAIGESGVVYINIPESGLGKVRIPVGGVVSFVSAASASGVSLPAGTSVRVVGVLNDNTVQVEATDQEKGF